MKKTVLLIILGTTGQLFAQSDWIKMGPPPPAIQIIDEFELLSASSHSFADVDNDGDQDVLISGLTASGSYISYLYFNDGTGAFTHDTSNSFASTYQGDVAFGDLDNDGDQDLIITGMGNAFVYLNNGSGSFTQSASLVGVNYSALALVDADGDSDLDVFVGGQANGGNIANLYMNDGSANFTLNTLASSTFPGIFFGMVEFGDVDNDGDQDVILMGYGDSDSHSELFLNDGNAVFTLALSNFPALNDGDIAFSDVDGDSDLDVLITGEEPTNGAITTLYLNDGTGVFTISSSNGNFLPTSESSMDFGDIDGDGDDDLLLSGHTPSGYASKIYTNDGSGVFTLASGGLTAVSMGSSKFTDFDGDSDLDILLTGNYQAVMYLNDGNGNYSTLQTSPFSGSESGAIVFADVDADNDLDLLITGQGLSGPSTMLYLNDGTGGYTFDNTNSFPNIANSAADFADIDNDGDEDLLVSGYGGSQATRLFTNDGTGVFTLVTSPFPNVSSGDIEFHDVDNDGDQDVMISGSNNTGNIGQLWMNNGTGNFSISASVFQGASSGNLTFADIDGDNDDDLLMSGYGDAGRVANLYKNDGTGQFTLTSSPFSGVQQGAHDFADIDGDNDLDLIIAGETGPSGYSAELYTNDGTGVFTLVAGTPFDPTITSGMIFVDIDNDLDPDLMAIGYSDTPGCLAKLYANDGTGIFTLISGTPFEAAYSGMMAFGDIDGDNDPDLVIAGNNCTTGVETNLYRNNNCQQSNSIDVHNSCTAFTWIDGVEYTESNHTASMTYANAAGCDSVVVLHLTVGDYDGAPDMAVLPNVTAECEVTNLTAPTATMNCTGAVTATTTQTFPISLQDTTEVVWTFTAPNGFEITQTQLVIIHDTTAPVPDMAVLPNVTAECEVTNLTAPTATTTCMGTLTATTTQTFPISLQDTTEVVWTYTAPNGLETTQTQLVIIHDVTPPVPDMAVLPNVTAECEVTNLTAPTATTTCMSTLTGTTTQTFPISLQDTTEVIWTYTSPNGLETTQTQLVIIHDVTPPVPDMASLPTAMSPCPFTTLSLIPTATDNCGGTIIGTSTDFPVTTPGTTTITWTFTDANGNTSTQTEDLIYNPLNDEVTFDGTTLTATQAFNSYQWYNCNTEMNIPGANSQTYTPPANGSYSVTVSNNECSVTSDCFEVTGLGVNELELSSISIYPNPNGGSFTIETSNVVSITISNAAGQVVHTEELQSGKSEMNLKGLESGVYFVNSIHANGSQTIQKVSIIK